MLVLYYTSTILLVDKCTFLFCVRCKHFNPSPISRHKTGLLKFVKSFNALYPLHHHIWLQVALSAKLRDESLRIDSRNSLMVSMSVKLRSLLNVSSTNDIYYTSTDIKLCLSSLPRDLIIP